MVEIPPIFIYLFLKRYIYSKIIQIMVNEHLIVEINEKYNFKKVTCKEGHYITDWNKENILEFTSSTTMYCPMNVDLSGYYCISEEEYNELMEQQEIVIKAREEEERNKMEMR